MFKLTLRHQALCYTVKVLTAQRSDPVQTPWPVQYDSMHFKINYNSLYLFLFSSVHTQLLCFAMSKCQKNMAAFDQKEFICLDVDSQS